MSDRRSRLLCLVLAVTACPPASAVIIRHDRPDRDYLRPESNYPMVGHLLNQVECTLIAPQWAVAAAHTIEHLDPFSDVFVTFGGQRYEIEKIIVHPDRVADAVDSSADLAVLKLARPVAAITPARLYDQHDEVGKVVVLVGRGATGDGLRGVTTPKGNQLRAATNVIEAALENSLITSFDAPPNGTELEGAGGGGDSGGPLLLEGTDGVQLVGVNSGGSGEPGKSAGKYGSFDTAARISTRRDWLARVMATDPASTVILWGPLVRLEPEPRWPDNPAAAAAAAFFAAFRSGDIGELATFYAAHAALDPSRPAQTRARAWQESLDHGENRLRTYGFRQVGPLAIAVVTSSLDSKVWTGYLFEMQTESPHRLASIMTGQISAPRE